MSKNSEIDPRDFRVRPGHSVKLKRWPTSVKPFYHSDGDYEQRLQKSLKNLQTAQDRLYAEHGYAVLLIFQALDAGGKDSAIKHVMSGVNPQGCQVFSFKQPSATELAHDFLWRTNYCLPERGYIGIFNRSYYEEVLVVRVHPELLQRQGLPPEISRNKDIWKHRYTSIIDLERHLHRNGTRVIKFFLHVSRAEQRKRLLRRLDDPAKNWKIEISDIRERKFWKDYVRAYEECLAATSPDFAPWYVVPGDDKKNARLIISDVIVHALKELKVDSAATSPKRRAELREIRKALAKE
jgi:PPK2 family polyphosphate:nucleotide phosphotransferase